MSQTDHGADHSLAAHTTGDNNAPSMQETFDALEFLLDSAKIYNRNPAGVNGKRPAREQWRPS